MNKHSVKNPWGLTHREVDTMDHLVELGSHKLIADRHGVSRTTVSSMVTRSVRKMGQRHHIRAVIMWDRWRQGDGREIPA